MEPIFSSPRALSASPSQNISIRVKLLQAGLVKVRSEGPSASVLAEVLQDVLRDWPRATKMYSGELPQVIPQRFCPHDHFPLDNAKLHGWMLFGAVWPGLCLPGAIGHHIENTGTGWVLSCIRMFCCGALGVPQALFRPTI